MTKSNLSILCASMGVLLLSLFTCQKNNLTYEHQNAISSEALFRSDSTILDTLKHIKPSEDKVQLVMDVIQNEWTFEEYLNTYHTLGGLLWNQAHEVSRNTINDDYLITIPFMKNDSISAILFNLYSDGQHTYDIVERTELENDLSELVDTYGYDHTAIILSSFVNHQWFYNGKEYDHDKLENLLSQPAAAYRCFYWQRVCHQTVVTVPGSGLPPFSRYDCYYKLIGGGCGGSGGVNIPISSGRPESGGGGGTPPTNTNEDDGGVSWEAPDDCTEKLAPWLKQHVNSLSFNTPCENRTTDEIVSSIMNNFCNEGGESGQIITKEMLDEELAKYDKVVIVPSLAIECPKFDCIFRNMMNGGGLNTKFICNLISNFDGTGKTEFDLIIKPLDFGTTGRDPNGLALAQNTNQNSNVVIYVNKAKCNSSPNIDIFETLQHELLHADIKRRLITEHGWNVNLIPSNHQAAFDLLMREEYGESPGQEEHDLMIKHYLTPMVQSLIDMNGGQGTYNDFVGLVLNAFPASIITAAGYNLNTVIGQIKHSQSFINNPANIINSTLLGC